MLFESLVGRLHGERGSQQGCHQESCSLLPLTDADLRLWWRLPWKMAAQGSPSLPPAAPSVHHLFQIHRPSPTQQLSPTSLPPKSVGVLFPKNSNTPRVSPLTTTTARCQHYITATRTQKLIHDPVSNTCITYPPKIPLFTQALKA